VACQGALSQSTGLPFTLYLPPADSTPTPTPFQPATRTAKPSTNNPDKTAVPQATQSCGNNIGNNFPDPQIYPVSTQIPSPVEVLPQPSGQINILLLGSDERPYTGGYRTDTIILATLNPNLGTVNLTSIPRDLYVYIPGWTMQRINTAMAHGGFEQMILTLEYNLGVCPDHYILINFANFISVVDSLGGIDVKVGQTLTDERSGYGWYKVYAGTVHMDGATALWYVRSRGTSSDIDRLRRSQEVMQAIASHMLSLQAVLHFPELYNQYRQSVETDIDIGDITELAPLAAKLAASNKVNRYVIDYKAVTDWVEPYSGAQVLLPNSSAIRQIMREALNVQ
jgi:LCP family protein required for cell wall assembly